jgi:hypothetical protein
VLEWQEASSSRRILSHSYFHFRKRLDELAMQSISERIRAETKAYGEPNIVSVGVVDHGKTCSKNRLYLTICIIDISSSTSIGSYPEYATNPMISKLTPILRYGPNHDHIHLYNNEIADRHALTLNMIPPSNPQTPYLFEKLISFVSTTHERHGYLMVTQKPRRCILRLIK